MARWFLLALASTSLLIGSAANNYSEPLDISALLNKFDLLFLVNALIRPSSISSISYSSKIPIFLSRFQIGYDRRVRPNYGGSPVTVGVSLYVLSLSEISEKFMDFTFDMYFRYNGLDIVENIIKKLVVLFFCQAILERRQIEI